jgi:hypothetical protein
MAGMRVQGPICVHHHHHAKHAGLTAGAAPAFPGHISLFGKRKKPQQSPKRSPLNPVGIRVNDKSQIQAAAWVQKINGCRRASESFYRCIDSRGQIIVLTIPESGLTPDRYTVDWIDDWRAAMEVDEWEVTTASLDIVVKKQGSPGKPQGVHFKTVLHPDLSSNESIDTITQDRRMTHEGDKFAEFGLEKGNTMDAGSNLESRRKLIAIANRITLQLGAKINNAYVVTDDELVKTWFHEIACHAGLITQKNPNYGHGEGHVNDTSDEIDLWIPGTQTGDQVFKDVKAFLNS